MAGALISGLKSLGLKKIQAADPEASRKKAIQKIDPRVFFFKENKSVLDTDVLILAVKPQMIKDVVNQIRKKIPRRVLVISIAAGIPLKWLAKQFPQNPVIRAMPNNPALIGAGMTALCPGSKATRSDQKTSETIFKSVGAVFWTQEKFIDLITALSGCGPAFFYYFVAALIESGQASGLSEKEARSLVIQTGLGAMLMLQKTKLAPEALINQVTSPGGTTLAGLKIFKDENLKNLIKKAIAAAVRRARELSRVK